jgi:pyruvate formate lyase activating enzyme
MKTAVLIGLSRHRIGVDGSGVTTLVAFHGCPLNCKYCLNPQALSPEGVWKRFTPEELYKAVSKDDLYFRATGGGITFGGGEPLISCKEILHFCSICLKNGKKWKINIETSLNVPKTFVELMKDVIDHWIVDIKDINPNIYKAYTGKDNKQVISNLQYLIDNNAKITARVPLIAGFNTELDVKNSILSLERMGIIDIDRFTYTVKKH